MDAKGQVTIFIIVAIVIVFGVGLIMFLKKGPEVTPTPKKDPKQFIQECVRDAVESSVGRIMMNGGQITPSQSIMYNGSEYNYLCYQADYYLPCYNLHPMLEEQIEKEIRNDTLYDVQNCFDSLKEDLESRGYSVSGEPTIYSIDVIPGNIDINLSKKIRMNKGEFSQSFEDFNERISSSLYELIKVARDVVNSESQFCNFEYNGYMLLYPQYYIKRIDYEGSKIYSLLDRETNEEFRFAVRSCVMPPGI